MNAPAKVSVVMPVFNGEKYLEASIQSVLSQTYPNVELLIIDGGSKDGSVDIIRKYKDRLAYWVSEPDKGMYDAINKGLQRAQGDVIAYLNSDDLYFPDSIESAAGFFRSHPETSMIFGDCEFIDAEGKPLYRYRYPQFDWTKFVALNWMSIPQPTVFWKKEVHRECGFLDPSFRMAGDFEFFSRVGRKYKVSHAGRVMARFRIHGESLSAKGVQANRLEIDRIREKLGLTLGIRKTVTRLLRETEIKMLNLPTLAKRALR